jgi:hypothetical protein
MPPDALHREDQGVWVTLVEAFCTALRQLFPSTRKRKVRAADGTWAEQEEPWSHKLDLINERLAFLAVEGRWEAFGIPCQGEYLQTERPKAQARMRARQRTHAGRAHARARAHTHPHTHTLAHTQLRM